MDEFDLRPDEQKRDINRINTTLWIRNVLKALSLFFVIFGCAYFFGMLFRTVITFSLTYESEAISNSTSIVAKDVG